MAHLAIALLGPFQATLDGQLITTFKSDKVRALLAYLAVEGDRPHARDTLAALLWPDWPEAYARSSLRFALANLRTCIGDSDATPPHLLITRETLQFNRESDHSLDLAAIVAAPVTGPLDADALERLRAAIELYRGDLLEGFSLPDSAPFEEWTAQERESLRQQARTLLHRLAGHDLERGEYAEAESYARRSLALEPWDEEAHRHLMRVLALRGDRSAALGQYEACRTALAEELGVEPEPETARLTERIRAGELRPEPTTAGGGACRRLSGAGAMRCISSSGRGPRSGSITPTTRSSTARWPSPCSRPRGWTRPAGPACAARPRPWADWGSTRTSSPSRMWARSWGSPI